jgi:uncharacterized membrane protein YuzA (DUF378 family)
MADLIVNGIAWLIVGLFVVDITAKIPGFNDFFTTRQSRITVKTIGLVAWPAYFAIICIVFMIAGLEDAGFFKRFLE